jgi:hypothetical protein
LVAERLFLSLYYVMCCWYLGLTSWSSLMTFIFICALPEAVIVLQYSYICIILVGCVSLSTSKDYNQGQPSYTEILWTGSLVTMLCILSLPKLYLLRCSCIIPCRVDVTHTVVRSSAWSINISSFERLMVLFSIQQQI